MTTFFLFVYASVAALTAGHTASESSIGDWQDCLLLYALSMLWFLYWPFRLACTWRQTILRRRENRRIAAWRDAHPMKELPPLDFSHLNEMLKKDGLRIVTVS